MAALASSPVVEVKVKPRREHDEASEREPRGVVILDLEQSSHAFVEGQCKRCGLDADDARGRDTPCANPAS